jgi:serine protease Do
MAELAQGVKVVEVTKGSLAEQAGIVSGDMIVKIDNYKAMDSISVNRVLHSAYLSQKPSVKVILNRNGLSKLVKLAIPQLSEGTKTPPAYTLDKRAIPGLENLIGEFSEQESQWDDVTFRVKSHVRGKDAESLATLVSVNSKQSGSFLVGKSSLVGEKASITLQNGKSVSVNIISRERENDLVLLRTTEKLKGGVKLAAYDPQVTDVNKLGRFVISPNPNDEGKISVIGSVKFESPTAESSGYLGIGPGEKDNKVIIQRVFPGTPALESGLKENDFILKVDGNSINTAAALIKFLKLKSPGDEVIMAIMRGSETMDIKVTLGERSSDMGHIADVLEFGKSVKRDGFSQVFTHDAPLKPSDCGGALFDMKGNFVGINMARYSRTQSYAVPASVVKAFVEGAL